MIKRAIDAFKRGEFLHEFVPCPKDLRETTSGCVGKKDNPEQIALEQKQADNVAKYGYSTWYDRNIAEWGTKWDVGGDNCKVTVESDPRIVNMSFDSAWSPPIEAYRALTEQGFNITAYYYEPGMGFCGKYSSDHDDEYYEIDGDSNWVDAYLPKDINDAFAISESMSEWEQTS